ncbi:unnamed protein product [Rhizophagus irregularis]|uniref:Uncharacterized protein n=1 Tax=Rhizophagus irregularis TaxID=588596 RepID=A0A916EAK3_9GLOM|nr:unnamed protein product [Rhizophagus irregularis]CAB5199125.1 unnamed protein product [Rhizophagus irregularis]CAB5372350.1 unnamed protein product [Rhizophagus irregularis]
MELAEDCVVNSVMVHSYFTSVKAGLWSLRHYIDWICKDERDLPLWETCLTAFYSSLGWIVKQRSIPQPIRVIASRIAEDMELPETKVLMEDLRIMYKRIYNGKYGKSIYETMAHVHKKIVHAQKEEEIFALAADLHSKKQKNDGNLNKGSDPSLLSSSIDISNSHGQNQRQADYYESPSDSFEDDDCGDYEVEDDNRNKDNVKRKKNDHDESDGINSFFRSPAEKTSTNLIRKRQKLDERKISNETDIEESEEEEDPDYVPSTSDVEDQNPPPLLTSSQFKCFDESYATMNKTHKWILSSGICVEDVIFDHCKKLSAESLLHSWIIDLDDKEAEALFTAEEWEEIRREIRKLPGTDGTFVNSVMRFADVKTTSELRYLLETTSFRNKDEPYDREKHYDAEWVELVMRKFLTDYEDPNGILHKPHLESWHDINVWSLIIDHGLRNLIGIETVRKESSSEAVSARKNRKRIRTRRKKIEERKKMGSRMDGIFRTYVNDIEYGAIEVAKKYDETKLLADGYKLSKAMHDILICLSRQVHFEETKVRQLRVVGMLHLGLKTQVLHLSSPKGYVSILKREKLLEVPVTVENIRDLIRVLTSVWMVKRIIMDCVDTVNSQVQNSTDFKQELVAMGTETPPQSIVLPWSCDTK